jgi:hypothetical protein
MKRKIILGIPTSLAYNDKNELLDFLRKNGFNVCSISTKIKEVAKYLLKRGNGDSLEEDLLAEIRRKGYIVNKLYWINLLLTSLPEKDKDSHIVIDDIWEEDLYGGYICTLVDGSSRSLSNTISCPSKISEADLKVWLKELMTKVV